MKNPLTEEEYYKKYKLGLLPNKEEKYKQYVKAWHRRDTRISVDINDPNSIVQCCICHRQMKRITPSHLLSHNLTGKQYKALFPDAVIVSDNLRIHCSTTELSLINKYGYEEGTRRWNEYCQLQSETNTFEYKSKVHGMTEEEFEEYNKSRACTLDNMIQRHGEIEGLEKWEDYCERQRYTTTVEYFIEKFGETDGPVKWKEFCVARGMSCNVEFIMQKYNLTREEAEERLADRCSGLYVSENEKLFVDKFIKLGGDIKYSYNTKQFCIWNEYTQTPMFYDMTCSRRKKIIEYNGDYWHANPNIYPNNYIVKKCNKSANEIQDRDALKKQSAVDRGFEVRVVWESEYLANPRKVLTELLEWWNHE
jgi:hypothetical protein